MRLATVQGTLHGSDHPGAGDSNSAADGDGHNSMNENNSSRFCKILHNTTKLPSFCKIMQDHFV